MNDIRQSIQFANFMRDIGWKTEKINSTYVYIRKLPFLGYFAKIPRPQTPFDFTAINDFMLKYKTYKLKIAPFIINIHNKYKDIGKQFLTHDFKIDNFPFNPTTTIQIDLTQAGDKLFKNFTEAKRRAVRRAVKNGVSVKESSDIAAFINIRKKQYFPLGFLIVKEMNSLWNNFYPDNSTLLLAQTHSGQILAGILLLYCDKVAYYWFASSYKMGKKLFAPTLLVWEAIKVAKSRGCSIFDFEGVYDERFPKASETWRGFTKFKEGFGGKKISLMENFSI